MNMSLSDIAFHRALKDFEAAPFHVEQHLTKSLALKFFASLSTDVPPAIAAVYIDNDIYYKRACKDAGMSTTRINEHCSWYKQMYFELQVQAIAEMHSHDMPKLLEHIKPCSDYIHQLRLHSIQHGFPIDALCANLPNLSKLELKFNGGKENRFLGLGNAISSAPMLVSVVLRDTNITDGDIVDIFQATSQTNLTHLDLSHNHITSVGLEIIIEKFITPSSVLSSLDLNGNKICPRKLGVALASNDSLLSLNLGLNEIVDDDGASFFRGIQENQCLRYVDVSFNKLGTGSARAILDVVGSGNTSIETVVISSNLFSDEELEELSQHTSCSVAKKRLEVLAPNDMICLASEVPSEK